MHYQKARGIFKLKVKIIDSGFKEDKKLNYVQYRVSELDKSSLEKLLSELEEEIKKDSDDLLITIYHPPEYFPLGSDEAQIRIEDFISREEIEMNIFLSSFLQED